MTVFDWILAAGIGAAGLAIALAALNVIESARERDALRRRLKDWTR